MKLPAELRNRIYNLALTSSKRIVLISSIRKYNRRHLAYRVRSKKLKQDKELLTASILRVNKQIYHEALPVLYNQPLELGDTAALYYFLAQIGNDGIRSIRGIKIERICIKKGEVTHPAFTVLAYATNLDTFSVECLIHEHTTRSRGSVSAVI